MTEFKCEQHKIDLICRGCAMAWIARHDAMLKIIKRLRHNGCCLVHTDDCLSCDALELLRQFGMVKDDSNISVLQQSSRKADEVEHQ